MKIRNPNHLTDAKLESLAQVICKTDSEEGTPEEGDISEDEVIKENEHNSDSEQEMSDSDNLENESAERGEQYVGRD